MNSASPNNRLSATELGLILYAIFSLTSMAMMSISSALLIACVMFDPGRSGPRRFGRELCDLFAHQTILTYALASVALITACVASLVYASIHPLTFGFDPIQVHWLQDLGKMWYFGFPLILTVAWSRLSEPSQARVLKAWILTFGVISAIGVLQFFTGIPRAAPNPLLPGYFHPVLFFGHHLSVASIWIFPFFAALEALVNPKLKQAVRLSTNVLLPIVLAGAFTLVFAYSRTLWVALPIGLVIWSVLRLPRKTALGAIAALAVLLIVTFFFSPAIRLRLEHPMGVSDRIELWKANLAFFESRPLLGVGFGKNQGLSYDYFRSIHPGQTDFFIGHAHNVYLEVLAGTGLLGAVAWLFWVGAGIGRLVRSLRSPIPLNFAGAALAAWVVFLINGATQVNFWEGKVLHQIMWMTGLSLYWAVRAPRPPHPSP